MKTNSTKKIISFFLVSSLFFLFSCQNDDRTFQLDTVKLEQFEKEKSLPEQKLFIKVFKEESKISIAETELYPSDLPLPATLKMYPSPEMNLYVTSYHLELWGNITGYIDRCSVHMDDYKIIFPIDMEVKGEHLEISMQGSWK